MRKWIQFWIPPPSTDRFAITRERNPTCRLDSRNTVPLAVPSAIAVGKAIHPSIIAWWSLVTDALIFKSFAGDGPAHARSPNDGLQSKMPSQRAGEVDACRTP